MTRTSLAVFHGSDRELELRRIKRPQPRDEEVLVRVLGCTLCGSDLHTYDGRRDTPLPTVLGHEIVGEIESFGIAAPTRDLSGGQLQVGDRVTWTIVASCGECFFCCRDLPQKCLRSVKYGHEQLRPDHELSGGLAQHCLLAAGTGIVRLPDSLSLSEGCPASCATATVAAALGAAGETRGQNVCLFGVGLLGLTAAAMLRVGSAENIVCVDVDESRLQRAKEFGGTHCVTPAELDNVSAATTDNHGFDIVFEFSGSPAAFESGWQVVRRGGTLVLVGSVFPTNPVSLSVEQIVRRNLRILGVHNYAPHDLVNAVGFLANHHDEFPFDTLVADWFPLDSAADAFRAAHDRNQIRVGIRP